MEDASRLVHGVVTQLLAGGGLHGVLGIVLLRVDGGGGSSPTWPTTLFCSCFVAGCLLLGPAASLAVRKRGCREVGVCSWILLVASAAACAFSGVRELSYVAGPAAGFSASLLVAVFALSLAHSAVGFPAAVQWIRPGCEVAGAAAVCLAVFHLTSGEPAAGYASWSDSVWTNLSVLCVLVSVAVLCLPGKGAPLMVQWIDGQLDAVYEEEEEEEDEEEDGEPVQEKESNVEHLGAFDSVHLVNDGWNVVVQPGATGGMAVVYVEKMTRLKPSAPSTQKAAAAARRRSSRSMSVKSTLSISFVQLYHNKRLEPNETVEPFEWNLGGDRAFLAILSLANLLAFSAYFAPIFFLPTLVADTFGGGEWLPAVAAVLLVVAKAAGDLAARSIARSRRVSYAGCTAASMILGGATLAGCAGLPQLRIEALLLAGCCAAQFFASGTVALSFHAAFEAFGSANAAVPRLSVIVMARGVGALFGPAAMVWICGGNVALVFLASGCLLALAGTIAAICFALRRRKTRSPKGPEAVP